MACKSKTHRVTRNAWTDGTSTSPGLYHSMLRLLRAEWSKARVSLITEGASTTTNVTVSTAVAYGDEESDFNSPTVVAFPTTPTSVTGNNTAWGSEFASFDAAKQQVDIGVRCVNVNPSTRMEHVRVTLVVDVSEEV